MPELISAIQAGKQAAPRAQLKSRKRVVDHGEVFTAPREVNAMLDLVKNETERIESRFLEPACGDGNFLAEILRRKLAVVRRKYRGPRRRPDFERWSIIALMNIYGVELLADNAAACRERLFGIWNEAYTANCGRSATDQCRNVARFILERNILCGDALTMKDAQGSPIVFSEWGMLGDGMVKRNDYTLAELLEPPTHQPDVVPLPKPDAPQAATPASDLPLLGLLGQSATKAPPPKPDPEGVRVAQFRPIHYLRLLEQRENNE